MMLNKEDVRRWLEGYRAVNEFEAEELRRELPKLTPEQSLAQYRDLCATWESCPSRDLGPALEALRLEELLERRRKLDRLAGVRSAR